MMWVKSNFLSMSWVKSNYVVIYFRVDKISAGPNSQSRWLFWLNSDISIKCNNLFHMNDQDLWHMSEFKRFICRLLKRQQVHNHVDMTHHKDGHYHWELKKKMWNKYKKMEKKPVLQSAVM